MWLRNQSGASAKSCSTWLQCMEAFSGSCWLRRLPVCPVYTGGWAAGTWYLVQAPVVSLWGMCWIYQWTSLANTWMIMQKDSFWQPCGCLRQWLVQNRRWLALSFRYWLVTSINRFTMSPLSHKGFFSLLGMWFSCPTNSCPSAIFGWQETFTPSGGRMCLRTITLLVHRTSFTAATAVWVLFV